MATSRAEKIENEIIRVKAKISEYQGKLRELEQKKTEIQNTEIVGMVRGLNMGLEDLALFLKSFREQHNPAQETDAIGATEGEGYGDTAI